VPATAAGFGIAALMSLVATPPAATVSAIIPALLLADAVGAYSRPWQRRAIGLVLVWCGAALVGASTPPDLRDSSGLVPTLAWTGLAVLGGVLAAGRAERVRLRATLLADIDRGRQAELRLAAAEQRHAIARDLHDSVAAAMTVICLHAAAARRRLPRDAAAVRAALETVQSTARSGIAELRASLDVLDGAASDGRPGPMALEAVIDAARATGMTVHLDLDAGCLAEEPGLLVSRIVREAVVNAARHAPGSTVTIRVVRGEGQLQVCVSDTGPTVTRAPVPADGTGHGLVGLSERVRASGGVLGFGPAGRGFQVTAALPLGSSGDAVTVQGPRGGDQVPA
jgi:signal transduction histidine kinase